MDWRRYIARTAVRRVVYVLVGLVIAAIASWFTPAHAQNFATRPQAWQACQDYRNANAAGYPVHKSDCVAVTTGITLPHYRHERCREWDPSCASGGDQRQFSWNLDYQCPGEQVFNDELGQCEAPSCTGGAVRMANGQCSQTPDECLAHNGQGFNTQASKPFESRCLANGCMLKMTPGTGSCHVVAGSGPFETRQVCNGEFGFTGEVCGAAPPPVFVPGPDTVSEASNNKVQECTPAGSNQTMCVKANGDNCYTSGSGRQTCWNSGETGTKTDGPNAQVRNAGEQPIPPVFELANGDTLAQDGQKVTTVTRTTNADGTKTITATTTNYKTIHGTNAGPKNQGQPADGSADQSDDESGSASGGADCEQKPIVSDPMLGMVATQAWATRCAVEAGNAVKVTGDVGDCKSNFTVEGTHANAEQLRAMRAQICGDTPQPEWTKVTGDGSEGAIPDPEESTWKRTVALSTSRIDMSGLGLSRSCPKLGTLEIGMFGSYNLDSYPWFCDFVIVVGGVILFLAGWQAVVILTRG